MLRALTAALLLLVSECQEARNYTNYVSVPNGGPWGAWSEILLCEKGLYARGFAIKVESPQGYADDTSLNGLQLVCATPTYNYMNSVSYEVVRAGVWGPISWCPGGVMISFSLRVQPYQGAVTDDTAANNIRFYCSDEAIIEGCGGNLGSYGGFSASCMKGMCGLQVRIELPQPIVDDTGMNDVRIFCCND
ncbi:vitelline membrane outer layer protein 1-like [Ambystoma mexicanum]|uniref:vitelline membrane outer layer protein 1-like n=1 Tax=Ambystoma mexicanum TaxID=8296 RepID=UPI0037E96302